MTLLSTSNTADRGTLHVAFCVNDAYVHYMCVAIKGIIDNHKGAFDIMVHILTDGITIDRLRQIERLFAYTSKPVRYEIHTVDDSVLKGLKVRHYTIYTWYRMLLPELLPDVDKILYLDTDIAVNADLTELYEFDMGDKAIATAMDTDTFIDEPFKRCGYDKSLQYVCVGVMLINLKLWRKLGLASQIIEWGRQHNDILKYPDQDSINYVCRELKAYLPLRYGVTKSLFTQPYFYKPEYAEQMRDALRCPAIVHYAGCAPWLMESDHPMVDIWEKYNQRLEYKAPRRYATKGVTGLKVRLWDMLHPQGSRAAVKLDEVALRIPGPKRKRILFFIESLQCGGAEKSLVSLLQMIDCDKYDVDLMLLRDSGVFRTYVPDGVRVVVPPKAKSKVLAKACDAAYALKWRLLPKIGLHRHNAENRWPVIAPSLAEHDVHYDVAIAYQQGMPTYYIAEKVKADKKIAWVNIDLQGAGYREEFNRPYYDRYDHVVAVSAELYDNLLKSKYIDPERLTTVYDILNVDLIRSMAKEPIDVPKDSTLLKLVTVGRLSRQKNYPLAVETARVLRDRGVNFVWTFVGEGAERPAIEALIDKYNLGDYVQLAGLQENPYPYIQQADIYVHTASFEGYGLTIAEAKILYRPVVSTNFRIVFDQITDGENGLIAEMTPESLADKIILMAEDDTLRENIVEALKKENNTTAITEVAKFYRLVD